MSMSLTRIFGCLAGAAQIARHGAGNLTILKCRGDFQRAAHLAHVDAPSRPYFRSRMRVKLSVIEPKRVTPRVFPLRSSRRLMSG